MYEQHEAPLTLRLLTPAGLAAEEHGDSVTLLLPDGKNGKGGGLLGIRRGHTPAVMALAEGTVTVRLAGQVIVRIQVPGGFASVENDIITIITDRAERL